MDERSEHILSEVHPFLAKRVRRAALELADEKIFVYVIQGLRSWNAQDDLHAMGRTAPGPLCNHAGVVRPIGACKDHPLGLTVTKAKGGESWHNFGLAVDVAPDKELASPGLQPDWNTSHPAWKRIVEVGEKLGMQSGGDAKTWRTWKDYPHLACTGKWPESKPPQDVIDIFQQANASGSSGIAAVWEASGVPDLLS